MSAKVAPRVLESYVKSSIITPFCFRCFKGTRVFLPVILRTMSHVFFEGVLEFRFETHVCQLLRFSRRMVPRALARSIL